MTDFVSGIKQISPTYPVKPVQPVHKDRETDRRRKPNYETPEKDDDRETEPQDGEHKPTIDEHV